MILLFNETDFPTLGTAPLPPALLKKALASAGPVTLAGIAGLQSLDPAKTELLVLPYGSAFPKDAWEGIFRYLEKGGNLLALGGRPLENPVRRDGKGWVAEPAQTAYYQSLFIEQLNSVPVSRVKKYQAAPGEESLQALNLPPLETHSLMPRFTTVDEEDRTGSTGPMDGELKPLIWGIDEKGRRVSTPALLLDRYQGPFAGGRWAFLPANLPRWTDALSQLVTRLALAAKGGAFQTTLRPGLACYQPGAQPTLNLWVRGHALHDRSVQVDFTVFDQGGKVHAETLKAQVKKASFYRTIPLPITVEAGLYRIEAKVSVNGRYSHSLVQGFWGWDEDLVKTAPAITVQGTRFLKDGKTLPVVGTTYMAGDVSRKFITLPNPAVWDADMAEMAASGINMIRTGIWAAHRQATLDAGNTREDVLGSLDAFLLTSIKHGLAVAFNFFSFIPDTFPSEHPYLDPRAIALQREYMLSFIRRYAGIPSVHWDFINEPSTTNPALLWKTRPLPGKLEERAFTEYLKKKHGDLETLRVRWNMTPEELCSWEQVTLPEEKDFAEPWAPGAKLARSPKAYDFNRFAQQVFADWVAGHVAVLKEATGQLFCVGQDEGGVSSLRPNNHLFHGPLDYTCNHTWWEIEDIVTGVTAARVKGKPFLSQETGIMFSDNLDRMKRRSEEEAARLFERKLAASFMGGAGFIQWCWNINQYMSDRNEVQIGAWRADRTARPEAMVMQAFGEFFQKAAPYLQEEPEEASLAVVESLTGLLSPKSHAQAAQRMSHRVLAALRLPFLTLAEHEHERVTGEKVLLFPSVKRLGGVAAQGWVKAAKGRTLWVSGPLAQDGWGRATEGFSSLGIQEERVEVLPEESLGMKGGTIPLNYGSHKTGVVDKDASRPAQLQVLKKNGTALYYSPLPVEANDQRASVAEFYRALATFCKVKPYCELKGAPEFEVTVLPKRFSKAALYIAFNESSRDHRIQVRDLKFGFKAVLDIPAGRAALAVFDAKGKKLLGYEGPDF
ncbi:MAG TPA: beta-galactosidase [bacterium]|nr:beta-galactosidase [bacterium]